MRRIILYLLFRLADGLDYGSCLVKALLVFLLRNGISYDACAGSDEYLVVLFICKSYSDACIEVAGKIDVSDSAAVDAALVVLEFVDDLACADLRGT